MAFLNGIPVRVEAVEATAPAERPDAVAAGA